MLQPLSSAPIAYDAAAASLPSTATNHVTLLTYGRSSASVVGSTQRYNTWQLDSTGDFIKVMSPFGGPSSTAAA